MDIFSRKFYPFTVNNFFPGGHMSKKISLLFAAFISFSAASVCAEETVRKLPLPDKSGEVTLMEAISRRQTTREFSAKKIDDQTLSDILFAAWGITHNGKHTIPTAKNTQDLNVYAVMPDGTWLYDPASHSLSRASSEDLRSYFNKQDFMTDAQLTLLYTGKDKNYAPMHAGSAYQNVGLYAASRGLNNVVRGYFDKEGIAKALRVDSENVLISQTIGWPYM